MIQLNTVKPALNSNPLTADRFDKSTLRVNQDNKDGDKREFTQPRRQRQ